MNLAMQSESRVSPGAILGNFDKRLYTSRQYVPKAGDITPDMAAEMLERATPGQYHSNARIQQYAAAVNGDKWHELIADQIAFTSEGKLVNGYHRLQAIVLTGRTMYNVTIAFGLDPSVYSVTDIGMGRKTKHMLRLADVPKTLAQPMGQGIRLYESYLVAIDESKLPRSTRFTPQTDHDFHLKNPKFQQIAEDLMGLKQTLWKEVLPPAVIISLAFMAIEKGHPQDVVLGFIKLIGNPETGSQRHPAWVLYKNLQKPKDGAVKREDKLAKAIRAYNKWVRKGEMSSIVGFIKSGLESWGEDTEVEDRVNIPQVVKYTANHHRNANEVN